VIWIAPVVPEEIDVARELIVEYAASLPIDLAYQSFAEEVAQLPGGYAPPAGRLLLARVDGAPAGCVGLRRLDRETCEMKRLYVRTERRGLGLGRRLVEAAIAEARSLGYLEMRLDTLATMTGAHALYERLGFREIPPYGASHAPGSRFYALELASG
jgi:GNAT superfamily N-acetyltransferase